MGKLDNTLIIYISGDNGTSAEGSLIGTPNEVAVVQRRRGAGRGPAQELLRRLGQRPDLQPHGGAAGPGRSTRRSSGPSRSPSHFGGTRQGMAISWPKVIKDKGGIRHQFHHVIDIVPTILEVDRHPPAQVGRRHRAEPDRGRQHGLHVRQGQRERAVDAPDPVFRDVRQPRASTTTAGSPSDKVDAPARGRLGPARSPIRPRRSRGSSTTSRRTGRSTTTSPRKNPDKLKEMQDLFWARPRSTRCCRSTPRSPTRLVAPRPSLTAGRTVFTYTGATSPACRTATRRAPQHLVHHHGRGRDARRAAPRA